MHKNIATVKFDLMCGEDVDIKKYYGWIKHIEKTGVLGVYIQALYECEVLAQDEDSQYHQFA
jgi:hypothetical protein